MTEAGSERECPIVGQAPTSMRDGVLDCMSPPCETKVRSRVIGARKRTVGYRPNAANPGRRKLGHYIGELGFLVVYV